MVYLADQPAGSSTANAPADWMMELRLSLEATSDAWCAKGVGPARSVSPLMMPATLMVWTQIRFPWIAVLPSCNETQFTICTGKPWCNHEEGCRLSAHASLRYVDKAVQRLCQARPEGTTDPAPEMVLRHQQNTEHSKSLPAAKAASISECARHSASKGLR